MIMEIIEAKSTTLSLLTNGKILSILRPWKIIVDAGKMQITVMRRNWHLINHDEATHAFKSVRTVKIDRHIFGANLSIKVYSGQAEVFYINKKKAKQIKDLLLEGSWNNGGTEIMVE
jgi:hypothetical protein